MVAWGWGKGGHRRGGGARELLGMMKLLGVLIQWCLCVCINLSKLIKLNT